MRELGYERAREGGREKRRLEPGGGAGREGKGRSRGRVAAAFLCAPFCRLAPVVGFSDRHHAPQRARGGELSPAECLERRKRALAPELKRKRKAPRRELLWKKSERKKRGKKGKLTSCKHSLLLRKEHSSSPFPPLPAFRANACPFTRHQSFRGSSSRSNAGFDERALRSSRRRGSFRTSQGSQHRRRRRPPERIWPPQALRGRRRGGHRGARARRSRCRCRCCRGAEGGGGRRHHRGREARECRARAPQRRRQRRRRRQGRRPRPRPSHCDAQGRRHRGRAPGRGESGALRFDIHARTLGRSHGGEEEERERGEGEAATFESLKRLLRHSPSARKEKRCCRRGTSRKPSTPFRPPSF